MEIIGGTRRAELQRMAWREDSRPTLERRENGERIAYRSGNFQSEYKINEKEFLKLVRQGVKDFRRVWFMKGGARSLPLYLTQYIEELNELYRSRRPFILTEANLSGIDAQGIDLSGSDLTLANFEGANLSGANLSNCTLANTRLGYANLSGANLRGTSFKEIFAVDFLCLDGIPKEMQPFYFREFKEKYGRWIDFSDEGYNSHIKNRLSSKERGERCVNRKYRASSPSKQTLKTN